MPAVLCGLSCFDVPLATTAGSVAREFSASLNPALNGAGCRVEVYRLEPVAPDVELFADDLVVCNIPGWQFDFAALEELHRHFEELRLDHDNLLVQYSRTKEILIALNSSVEASEESDKQRLLREDERLAAEASAVAVVETPIQRRGSGGNRREVEQLKLQLTQSEKKQQETKATVMALRNEFMQLVNMMQGSGSKCGFELPSVMKELDTNVKGWPQALQTSPCEIDRPGAGAGGATVDSGKPRHGSQPPMASGARRPLGSPRVYRSPPGTYTTPRAGARAGQRGVHQRSGHSAGASTRQKSVEGRQ